MLNSIFETTLSLQQLLLCSAVSIIIGFLQASLYMYRNTYSKTFVTTLVILPLMVQIVIMMVNGNLGTGVAVLGAFGLVRFRSVPGSAKEISAIFFSMAVGLATGMGYLTFAFLITLMVGILSLGMEWLHFANEDTKEKLLKITVPENIDYTQHYDEIFQQYTQRYELLKAKTVHMGSLFEVQYRILLKHSNQEKALLDALRTRNGNLTILCMKNSSIREEL